MAVNKLHFFFLFLGFGKKNFLFFKLSHDVIFLHFLQQQQQLDSFFTSFHKFLQVSAAVISFVKITVIIRGPHLLPFHA